MARLSPFPRDVGPTLSVPLSPPLLAPPPSMPLPPIPTAKARSRLPEPNVAAATNSTATTPRREVSGSMLPTQGGQSFKSTTSTPSSIARLRTPSSQSPAIRLAPVHPAGSIAAVSALEEEEPVPDSPSSPTQPSREVRRSVRRTVSIGSFPQPPKGGFGSSSNASSPEMASGALPARLSPIQSPVVQADSNRNSLGEKEGAEQSTGVREIRRPRASLIPTAPGIGAASISATPVTVDKLLPSLPDERPGSNATERTQFEDIDPPLLSPATSKSRLRMPAADTGSLRSVRSVKSSSTLKDGRGNVVVSVRVRPTANAVEGTSVAEDWLVDSKRSNIAYKGGEGGDFRYDNVFAPAEDNEKVYDSTAKRLVRRVMEGYHGTVFAYGITGTGKTFSMQGTAHSPGIIPLAITDIFSYIRDHPDREFLLRVSYLEIYNEKIFDLLASTHGNFQQEEIKLREDSKRGVYATPLKEEIVQSPTQLLRVIARGDLARRTASTQFNARSSRSHAVVQIIVESRQRAAQSGGRDLPGGVLISTLSLIDLAGSERAAEDKERRTEGSHINKSLLTLGTVISRLSGDKNGKGDAADKSKHLPYRDSKLTRLLQSALSGNALVSILCTVQLSPMGTFGSLNPMAVPTETLNTLNFASRAKNNIVSHAKKNESHPAHGGDARALLDRYRAEIEDLKKQLEEQSQTKAEPVRTEEEEERWLERERESVERHEEQMLEMHLARTALKERIGHLNRLILSSKSAGVNTSAKPVRDRRTPASDEVGVALGSPELGSRQSSIVSDDLDANVMRAIARKAGAYGSALRSHGSSATLRQDILAEEDEDDEIMSADSGEASPRQQILSLQSDLVEKNRYIATLERRLLEARRVTHRTRKSTASAQSDTSDDMIAERDREIAELRSRLDDQTKMVQALRNATRRRGLVDLRSASTSNLYGAGLSIDTTLGGPGMRRTQSGGLHASSPTSRSINFSRPAPSIVTSPTSPHNAMPDSGKSMPSAKSLDDMNSALDRMLEVQRNPALATPLLGTPSAGTPDSVALQAGGLKFGATLTVREVPAPLRPMMVGMI